MVGRGEEAADACGAGRPRRGSAKRGELGRPGTERGSPSRGSAACRRRSRTRPQLQGGVGAPGTPRGGPRSDAGGGGSVGQRSSCRGCRSWCPRELSRHFGKRPALMVWPKRSCLTRPSEAGQRKMPAITAPGEAPRQLDAGRVLVERSLPAIAEQRNEMTIRSSGPRESWENRATSPENCHRIRLRGNRRPTETWCWFTSCFRVGAQRSGEISRPMPIVLYFPLTS